MRPSQFFRDPVLDKRIRIAFSKHHIGDKYGRIIRDPEKAPGKHDKIIAVSPVIGSIYIIPESDHGKICKHGNRCYSYYDLQEIPGSYSLQEFCAYVPQHRSVIIHRVVRRFFSYMNVVRMALL